MYALQNFFERKRCCFLRLDITGAGTGKKGTGRSALMTSGKMPFLKVTLTQSFEINNNYMY
jgi:hypothetical protein